ncbi:MAG: TAT-variant-translocated molybdopterin oxidoreductase [Phycisphaerales bacterium]|nr:TAT-variant-translocated molybdopterin oxidoreductase [Phycisphaerales bacterium]
MSHRPSNHGGRTYWQSFDHLEDAPSVQELLSREFPGYSPSDIASMPRRRFLKLMGASLALSGLTLSGCRRWPREQLAPYTYTSAERIPGEPEFYATCMELGGVAKPLLAKAFDGRPIKIEGNPSHPASATWGGKLGSADHYAQASVLELYDPDRSRFVIDRSGPSPRQATFEEFSASFAGFLKANCPAGSGFAILSEASESPSVLDMKNRLLAAMPQTRWVEYEPLSNDNELLGVKQATGKAGRAVLKLDQADVVVSFEGDFLGIHPAQVQYANEFSRARRAADTQGRMNRLFVIESTFSLTGSNADERLPVRPSRVELLAAALASELGIPGVSGSGLEPSEKEFIAAAAHDLRAAGSRGLVVAGAGASPTVHVLAYLINSALKSIGSAVTYVQVPDRPASHPAAIAALAQEMRAGGVKALLILGGNPAFDAPADVDFSRALGGVGLSAHLSLYMNETSLACKWHVPRAHYLEAWGDGRSWDGTIATAQPLIEPLFGGKSVIEVLAMLCGEQIDGQAIVRRALQLQDDAAWRKAIHDGVIPGTSYPPISGGTGSMPQVAPASTGKFELRFVGSYSVYDGRFANLGWLQELPDPLTRLTWDNAALLSKKDADALGVKNGDMIAITANGRTLEIPAFILPGTPAGVITLPVGFGRRNAGSVGGAEGAGIAPAGFDVYRLRGTDAWYFAQDAKVTRAAGTYKLISTQDHHLIDDVGFKGREVRVGEKFRSGRIVREATFRAYYESGRQSNVFHPPDYHGPASRLQLFTPPTDYPQADPGAPDLFNHPHAWGMAIDMTACIGCGACAVACQAENNIAVVGKEMVELNREMNWLRIDRYFKTAGGSVEEKRNDPNPQVVFQPMMCVQCENAPCEQVCPVAATVHDTEGLNTMVYNRCIGTRYCSNNCPYKVRRFNYYDYHATGPRSGRYRMPFLNWPDRQQKDQIDPLLWMQFNPEVTVRMRGVMEKCTYCTQRIAAAKIHARNEWKQGKRPSPLVRDGEIVTACQQACPTEAIVFGNLNDSGSVVRKWQENPRAYAVLDDLNTRPRTRYLAKLRNPVREPQPPAEEKHH